MEVLDYSSQQFLLFPQLALCYAMHFAALAMEKLYFANLKCFGAGDFSGLQLFHCPLARSKLLFRILVLRIRIFHCERPGVGE